VATVVVAKMQRSFYSMSTVLDFDTDQELHRADIDALEKRIMELALSGTGASHGAIFLYDSKRKGLVIDFHMVEGLVVTFSQTVLRRRKDGRPNGIALWVHQHNEPYLCSDADNDPNYARYFLDVRSIAAVPIPYQQRSIGVLSVSSRRADAFDAETLVTLGELASSAAKFLRRAQLDRNSRNATGRPFLIKGLSSEWLEVERRIEQVAATVAPVLVVGESGTGKDLVARAVHFNSKRAAEPFVVVNCAAIPEALLESVLFGHVKGAFTGASFDKLGEFQKAEGGTLFLDELGELPLSLQAKVLRAVEQGEVQPLGSNKAPAQVDVRLICATNRDLGEMVRQQRFRDDLYYRLSVMTMELPPLRSYKDGNIETLASLFLQQAVERHQLSVKRLSRGALAVLQGYDFPGNVRELKNALEHAAIMASGSELVVNDLPSTMHEVRASGGAAEQASPAHGLRELRELWLAPLERRYLIALLEECQGNVRQAAKRAGINTVTMYRLLKKRGLTIKREVRGAN
jgi:two-component system response regulator HydG